jgi:hypothetical protein
MAAGINVAQDVAFCAACGEMHKLSVLSAAAASAPETPAARTAPVPETPVQAGFAQEARIPIQNAVHFSQSLETPPPQAAPIPQYQQQPAVYAPPYQGQYQQGYQQPVQPQAAGQGAKNPLLLAAFVVGCSGLIYIVSMMWSFGVYDSMFRWLHLMWLALTAALVFNIVSWQKNSAVCTLIAAILYILGFFPSAILCFIGFARLNKQGARRF